MKRTPTSDDEIIQYPNGIYYFRGTLPGRRATVEISLKTKCFKTAKTQKAELVNNAERVSIEIDRRKAGPLLELYLRRRIDTQDLHDLSDNTIKGDEYVIRNFLIPFFGEMFVHKIDEDAFDDFTAHFGRRDYKNHRKILTSFLKYCRRKKYIFSIPTFEIPRWKKRQRETLTGEECRRLLVLSEGNLRLFVSMYLLMGMRKSEIIKLRWENIDFINGGMRIVKETSLRSGKTRVIPINPHVLRQLLAKREKSTSEWVFPNKRKKGATPHMSSDGFNRPWDRLLSRAGITRDITPHDLRATYQSEAHKRTDFTKTQLVKMAGSSIETQVKNYVSIDVSGLRGLESVISFPEVRDVLAIEVPKELEPGSGEKTGESEP